MTSLKEKVSRFDKKILWFFAKKKIEADIFIELVLK